MKTSFLLAAVLMLASLPMTAKATIILSVSSGPDTLGQTSIIPPGVADLVTAAPGNAGVSGDSVNTITLEATALSGYQNGTAFTWNLGFADAADGSPQPVKDALDGNTKYLVTVKLTNLRMHPIAPVRFTLTGIGNPPVPPVGLHDFQSSTSPKPTSTYNTVNFNGHLSGTPTLQFGGLNGGGGELPTNGVATFTFHIDLKDYPGGGAGTLLLSMVANPEPASLVLGGVAIALAGGYRAARRRRKKLGETEETVAV